MKRSVLKAAPLKSVELYTDGACSGNPGAGGWACILVYGKIEKELSGGAPQTTNNKMELTAVIEGLKALKGPCAITIYTDSKYVMDGVQKWAPAWIQNNWKTAAKKTVLNQELWKELLAQLAPHQVKWEWVKGHAGHPYNERADALACQARDEVKPV